MGSRSFARSIRIWTARSINTAGWARRASSGAAAAKTAAKQHDGFQTGELVQVGQAWRLVDIAPEIDTNVSPSNPQFEKLLAALGDIEQQIAKIPNENMKPNKELAGHYYDRAALCEKI